MNFNDWNEQRAAKPAPDPGQVGYSGPPCVALMGYRGPYPVPDSYVPPPPPSGERETSSESGLAEDRPEIPPPALPPRRGRPPGSRTNRRSIALTEPPQNAAWKPGYPSSHGPYGHPSGPSATELALRKIREERDARLKREVASEFNDLMSGSR